MAEMVIDAMARPAQISVMKTSTLRAAACLLTFVLAAPVVAQSSLRFEDLAGWWSADPVHGGESSHLALQFVAKDGKQEARLSLAAIGAYDINLGEVAITGNSLQTRGLAFPLTWNPATQSLTGVVPADAAPLYEIPVEFRRGQPFEKPAPNEWKAPRPVAKWSVDTGGAPIWAGIERADDGTLYVANDDGVLQAIRGDGKPRWRFASGKPIRAQPRVHGAHVYLHSDSGFLYKLDRKTGAEVWRARVDTGSEPRKPTNEQGTRWDRYGSSVVADRKHLYVASRDKNLYALDLQTGRESWRVAAGDIMTATPALYRELVIFAAYDGKVQAVSASDGKLRWTFDARLAVAGDLTVAGDRVLLGSRSYDLISLNAATGQEQWRRYYWFSWIESPPVVRDGVVYTGSSDAVNVYAINLADGAVRWKRPVPGYSWQRTALSEKWLVAGTVGSGAFPGPRAGSLVAMDRDTGEIRWIYLDPPSEEIVKAGKGWGFGASPVIAEGVLYAADLAGKVYAFDLK
jgi:outer membrane protein assembly factor BamB